MKRNLFVTSMVTALMFVFSQCSEDEMITPKEQVQPSAESLDRENDAARRNTGKFISTPTQGTINGIPFTAEYRITEFVHENNKALYAVATLNNIVGEGLPAAVTGLVGQQIMVPVELPEGDARASATSRITCDVLNLVLGPLDLDLLGLQVHLDQVVLEIVAEAGAGNLLGNLLCAITSLLDPVAAIAAIAELLNNIIDLIGMFP
jgi:hypothetical protein